MKKLIAILLSIVCVFIFAGCGEDKEEVRDWRQDFEVKCTHIEESKFDDPTEKLDALLNGTFVFEHDEYSITNKTNYVADSVYLVFHVDITGMDAFDFKKYVGAIKQGTTVTESITESYVETKAGYVTFPDGMCFDFDDCQLIKIEYELK